MGVGQNDKESTKFGFELTRRSSTDQGVTGLLIKMADSPRSMHVQDGNTTIADLQREPREVMRVVQGGEDVVLTDSGKPVAEVLEISNETANHYAELRHQLKQAATPIPSNDTWIAALARRFEFPILSNDPHFDLIQGVERISF